MKNKIVGILAVVVLAGAISLLWAQTQTPMAEKTEMAAKESMKMMGPMDLQKGCPMCGAMMLTAMQKQMIATPDGDIIILTGCSLQKYNADLQLVKEAELKIDTEKMGKRMQDMMKNCPMPNCPMKQK